MQILKNILKIKEISFLRQLAGKLNCEIYIVGSALRALAGRTLAGRQGAARDIDFAVKGDIDLLCKEFAKHFKYKLFYLDKKRKIIRVVMVAAGLQPAQNKITFDFSYFDATIQEDLSRRDFTINSIAYDIKNNIIIDPLGGVKDLKNKIIRTNAEANIIADPIRILRAFRLAEQLKCKIEKKTLFFIKKHIKLLRWTNRERITEEFFKALKLTDDFKSINYLFKIGIIGEILNIAQKSPVPARININNSVKKIGDILKKYNVNLSRHLNTIISADRTRLDLIKFVLILIMSGSKSSDLSKTNILLSNRETSFDKLIFSEAVIKPSLNLATFQGLSLKSGKIGEKITSKRNINKFYPFYKKNKDVFIDIVILLDLIGVNVDNEIIKTYFKFLKNEKAASRLINGDVIKKELGIKEGKQLGRILEKIRRKIITGIIINKIELLGSWLLKNRKNREAISRILRCQELKRVRLCELAHKRATRLAWKKYI